MANKKQWRLNLFFNLHIVLGILKILQEILRVNIYSSNNFFYLYILTTKAIIVLFFIIAFNVSSVSYNRKFDRCYMLTLSGSILSGLLFYVTDFLNLTNTRGYLWVYATYYSIAMFGLSVYGKKHFLNEKD